MRAISLANGNKPPSPKGTVWTESRKEKLRQKKLGIKRPEHVREAMAKTHFRVGHSTHNKGRVHLPAERNPQWKGGTSHNYKVKQASRPKPDKCEVCGALGSDFKKGLCFDHDHSTGLFRGWLCTRCNVALGMVKENIELLQALIDYIKSGRDLRDKVA